MKQHTLNFLLKPHIHTSSGLHSHPAKEYLFAKMTSLSIHRVTSPQPLLLHAFRIFSSAPFTVTQGTYWCLGTNASVASAAARSKASPLSPAGSHA